MSSVFYLFLVFRFFIICTQYENSTNVEFMSYKGTNFYALNLYFFFLFIYLFSFYHLYIIWEFHKCGIYVFKNNNMSNRLQCFESINNFLTPIRFAYLLDNSIAGLSWVLSIDFDIFITFFLICQTFFV